MTKYQFLDTLRTALNGKVSQELLAENMRYYEDYINTEIRKGKNEEDVLGALGDPRLIARTIVETKGGSGAWYEESSGSRSRNRRSRNGRSDAEDREQGMYSGTRPSLFFRLPLWLWAVILLVVVVLILSVVFSVISAILPVLLPILLVLFLVKLFRDWVN